jgi:hypothetical protein
MGPLLPFAKTGKGPNLDASLHHSQPSQLLLAYIIDYCNIDCLPPSVQFAIQPLQS